MRSSRSADSALRSVVEQCVPIWASVSSFVHFGSFAIFFASFLTSAEPGLPGSFDLFESL